MIKKTAIVVGTRPEIIKLASLIKEYQKRCLPFILIHSNQHYSFNMDEIFFDNLNLPRPDYNLNIGSGGQAIQTARILEIIEPILIHEKIGVLYVQGDTNTTMPSALAASKLDIKVAHVEAGLRSYDRAMPEEINRIITDHISDFLFVVNNLQKSILLQEGINEKKIHVVGNSVVDTLHYARDLIIKKKLVHQYDPKSYILITAHRPSNVDTKEGLCELINIFASISSKYKLKSVWPIHPRTKKNIKKFRLQIPNELHIIEPVGYIDFVSLMINAYIIMTDSGGIQEESCILKVPCITMRSNTERPESLEVGANKLVSRDINKVLNAFSYFESRSNDWDNPFGDGKTALKVVDIIFQK